MNTSNKIELSMPYAITNMAINEERNLIAASNAFVGEIIITDLSTKEVVKTLKFEDSFKETNSLYWKGGNLVSLVDAGKAVKVWDENFVETTISIAPCSICDIYLSDDGENLVLFCHKPYLKYLKEHNISSIENIYQYHLPSLTVGQSYSAFDAKIKLDVDFEIQGATVKNEKLILSGNITKNAFSFGVATLNDFNSPQISSFVELNPNPCDASKVVLSMDHLFVLAQSMESPNVLYSIQEQGNGAQEENTNGIVCDTLCNYKNRLMISGHKGDKWFVLDYAKKELHDLSGESTDGMSASENYLAIGIDEKIIVCK